MPGMNAQIMNGYALNVKRSASRSSAIRLIAIEADGDQEEPRDGPPDEKGQERQRHVELDLEHQCPGNTDEAPPQVAIVVLEEERESERVLQEGSITRQQRDSHKSDDISREDPCRTMDRVGTEVDRPPKKGAEEQVPGQRKEEHHAVSEPVETAITAIQRDMADDDHGARDRTDGVEALQPADWGRAR